MALTVRQWRRAKEITQEDMAKSLEVHVGTYQKWEESPGKISIDNALKIAKIFDVSLNDISFKNEGTE